MEEIASYVFISSFEGTFAYRMLPLYITTEVCEYSLITLDEPWHLSNNEQTSEGTRARQADKSTSTQVNKELLKPSKSVITVPFNNISDWIHVTRPGVSETIYMYVGSCNRIDLVFNNVV